MVRIVFIAFFGVKKMIESGERERKRERKEREKIQFQIILPKIF